MANRPAAATEQLQAGILAAREAHATMLEVAPRLPANLAWRAEATSERIGACLQELWGIG